MCFLDITVTIDLCRICPTNNDAERTACKSPQTNSFSLLYFTVCICAAKYPLCYWFTFWHSLVLCFHLCTQVLCLAPVAVVSSHWIADDPVKHCRCSHRFLLVQIYFFLVRTAGLVKKPVVRRYHSNIKTG